MKTFLISILLTAFSVYASGQDINFSQFYELSLLRNPALGGFFKGDIKSTAAFRSQWGSVTVPFQTSALAVETKFTASDNSDDYWSFGMQITNDVAGDSRMGRTQFLPAVTYHKIINADRTEYLSAGFLGGFVQQRFDPSRLNFDDQFVNGAYSPTNPTRQAFESTNATFFDMSAGLAYSVILGVDTRFYVGAGLFHVNRPRVAYDKDNDYRLNAKYVFNAGLSLPASDYDRLVIYSDIFMQGGNLQGQGGLILNHNFFEEENDQNLALGVGTFLRWNDAVIPVVRFEYYKLNIGLSYDVNISKLKTASQYRGGFEVTLSFKSFLNIMNSSQQKVRCPVEF
jgi:type IX secretion system PorP/SprF family membrane protein